ncbi:cobalamin biosynthesis protein [Mobilicoccus massiliensis]|uniref:cobalamin biosynthesis protein n=1 Tax=Mobilicoccus massiliensis TaxID=1522310 RepID=UPI0009E45AB7|nr:cobalamin biosynthesis protein [Mobilicoccus massiliensis]
MPTIAAPRSTRLASSEAAAARESSPGKAWAATASARSAGLALGYAADLVFGDPRRGHPVAVFGSLANALGTRLRARQGLGRSRAAGVAYTGILVGGSVALGLVVERLCARRPLLRSASTAVATWAVLGGTSLAGEGRAMARLIGTDDGDLGPARLRLGHLCSRDATGLDAAGLARAATESLAENTSDAVTAPLWWGAIAGVPGLLGYRAANTLDAMVGYRTPELREFGWASARFDDIVNLVPARVTAALTVLLAPVVGGSSREAWRVWRRDAAGHPSPNAGPVEASAAGALGVRLGGENTYSGEVEDRGTLGDGPPAGVADLPRAVRLSRAVSHASLLVAVLVAAARGPIPVRSSR